MSGFLAQQTGLWRLPVRPGVYLTNAQRILNTVAAAGMKRDLIR